MSVVEISKRVLEILKPASKPYYFRDYVLTGFGVRVYPSGKIMFIAEVWYKGKSSRKSLGTYPIVQPQQARLQRTQVYI